MTTKEKHDVVTVLLQKLKTQVELIAEELKIAEDSLNDKDTQFNPFNLLLGSTVTIPDHIKSIENTFHAMTAMAKQKTTA